MRRQPNPSLTPGMPETERRAREGHETEQKSREERNKAREREGEGEGASPVEEGREKGKKILPRAGSSMQKRLCGGDAKGRASAPPPPSPSPSPSPSLLLQEGRQRGEEENPKPCREART
jgi:hypothetical protein